MASFIPTRRYGSIRDAKDILGGRTWDPRGRHAYDGSVLDAVRDANRAPSSLRGEDKVLLLCSTLFTGQSDSGLDFCRSLESRKNVYTSGHEPPILQLPYNQELPTVDNPNPPNLTNAQIEANNAARLDHGSAIEKYWYVVTPGLLFPVNETNSK